MSKKRKLVNLKPINELASRTHLMLSQHDNGNGLLRAESNKIAFCTAHTNCHSKFCPKCLSRRGYRERKHLYKVVPELLKAHPGSQLWFLTATTKDSLEVNKHARAAVSGMRKMLKHPDLKPRVISSFSVLEVSPTTSKQFCAHVHTILICRPITAGRSYLSVKKWVTMWEESCPLARPRAPGIPLKRASGTKRNSNPHISFLASKIKQDTLNIDRTIRYATKWGGVSRFTKLFGELMLHPTLFIRRFSVDLLHVPRYFGPMTRGRLPATKK